MGVVTRLRAGRYGVWIPSGARDLSLKRPNRLQSWYILLFNGSGGVGRLLINHQPPPFIPDVKNNWSYISTPPVCLLGVCNFYLVVFTWSGLVFCIFCCVFSVVLFLYGIVLFSVLLYSSVLLYCSLLFIVPCSFGFQSDSRWWFYAYQSSLKSGQAQNSRSGALVNQLICRCPLFGVTLVKVWCVWNVTGSSNW